jgi:hypothetical protein
MASANGNVQMAKLLLSHGADVSKSCVGYCLHSRMFFDLRVHTRCECACSYIMAVFRALPRCRCPRVFSPQRSEHGSPTCCRSWSQVCRRAIALMWRRRECEARAVRRHNPTELAGLRRQCGCHSKLRTDSVRSGNWTASCNSPLRPHSSKVRCFGNRKFVLFDSLT